MAHTQEERLKLEQEKENLQRKEEAMRETLQAEFDKKEKDLQERREDLAAERRDWEEEKERVKQTKVFEKVVTLDVGGTKYRTTLSTLTKYPDSMLGVMFSGRHDLPQQEDGSYFIDRDGEVFKYILMYLRDRDLCFDCLRDEKKRYQIDLDSLCLPEGAHFVYPLSLPSPSHLLKQIAYEAQYFQLTELETKVQIILDAIIRQFESHGYEGDNDSSSYRQIAEIRGLKYYSTTKCHDLEYGQGKLQCHRYSNAFHCYERHIVEENSTVSNGLQGTEFTGKVTFNSCDLSGVTFCNCYFQQGVSFEGCILHGTKFECVGGLISHKVHFAPWQVAQADFEPELLQALRDNGCIY